MKRRKLIAKGHMITENITEMEQEVLDAITQSEYMDGDIENGTYDFAVDVSFDRASFSGVVSSLVKKNLVWTDEYEGDLTIGLTPKGILFVSYEAFNGAIFNYYETVAKVGEWFLSNGSTVPRSFGEMGWS